VREHLRRYGDESVVFNPHTWQTHVLNAAAAEVLDVLCRGSQSVTSLHAELARELDEPSMQVLNESNLQQLLQELAMLRLLETRP
jgi:PqqD family protein of HPr-rel-A system